MECILTEDGNPCSSPGWKNPENWLVNANAFSGIRSMLNTTFSPLLPGRASAVLCSFLRLDHETPEMIMISGIAQVTEPEKTFIYEEFSRHIRWLCLTGKTSQPGLWWASNMIWTVGHSVHGLCYTLLLISFGRIELPSLPLCQCFSAGWSPLDLWDHRNQV